MFLIFNTEFPSRKQVFAALTPLFHLPGALSISRNHGYLKLSLTLFANIFLVTTFSVTQIPILHKCLLYECFFFFFFLWSKLDPSKWTLYFKMVYHFITWAFSYTLTYPWHQTLFQNVWLLNSRSNFVMECEGF